MQTAMISKVKTEIRGIIKIKCCYIIQLLSDWIVF